MYVSRRKGTAKFVSSLETEWWTDFRAINRLIYPSWSSWAAQKYPLHYMWISCLVISGIQILVVLLPQKAGRRFLSHFALCSALKPYWQMKFQLTPICINTKMVKLFAFFLLFTHIYSPWVGRVSITCLVHLNGPSGGGAEMMVLRSLNSLSRDVASSLTSPELPLEQLTSFCQVSPTFLLPAWGWHLSCKVTKKYLWSDTSSHEMFVWKQDFCWGGGAGVEARVD